MVLNKVIATAGCLMCFWSFLCKGFNKPELNKKMYDAERHNCVKNISQFVLLTCASPLPSLFAPLRWAQLFKSNNV